MDTLSTLKAMGLSMPSPYGLIAVILFSIVGWVAYRQGKRLQRPVTRWVGLALMLYPYVVDDTVGLYVVGLGLVGVLWWDRTHGAA